MPTKKILQDGLLKSTLGFDISFHAITWGNEGQAEAFPTGGNINYHSIPASGTLPHTHEFAEIILVLRGGVNHLVNGETRRLEAGNLVFLRPSDYHSFKPFRGEPCEMLILAYQLELLLSMSRFFENDSFLWRYTEPVLPPTFILNPDVAESLANRMLNVRSDPYVSPALMRVKTKVIIADLFTSHFLEDISSLEQDNIPEWLAELCKKMRRPDNLKSGLRRMQKLACCTPEHLCKIFRRHLNKTPTGFINELRINYAAQRLADSKDEIIAIAMDLNFQSLSRFYHLFKEHYGLTPAQYRKNSRDRTRIL